MLGIFVVNGFQPAHNCMGKVNNGNTLEQNVKLAQQRDFGAFNVKFEQITQLL